MERSWDPYYKYFKEFEFNLFEIFIFLEFQQEIVDLGYIISVKNLNPGRVKIVHEDFLYNNCNLEISDSIFGSLSLPNI